VCGVDSAESGSAKGNGEVTPRSGMPSVLLKCFDLYCTRSRDIFHRIASLQALFSTSLV
jgi:hypothetical protein